ncbi:ABC transporter ATP-binding protein [Pseudacidovorax intermedius]|uniref:ABC transporter ATP-binding protein n=1 Tax=Pseudacidovorax intermedius TaxID=433924 RepID=UPI001B23D372|nr:ABC transporter ATP-binding protein [Pseudacidovorax intermedius]MBO9641904.1 ABC transporter ATP-binding protein [Pseudacidovorax sp.]
MAALLEARGACAGYAEIQVLAQVDVAIPAGSITAIVGSNGAGKSTLMRALAGLLRLSAGAIRFDGADITHHPAHVRVDDGIALVPEGRLVFPELTVADTLRIGAFLPRARRGWQDRAESMYRLFPRLRARRDTNAGRLSGGEQQMLALARGLMSMPRVLLLDEPSLGLAPAMADEVFGVLRDIRDQGVTIGIVEQNVYAALAIADQAYVMEDGRVVSHGPSKQLIDDPAIRTAYLGL